VTPDDRAAARPDAEPGSARGWQRRRRVLLVAVVVIALGWVVLASPLLAVHQVEVVGALGARDAQVRAAARVRSGDNLVTTWPGRVADRVRGVPWVATAQVTRSWLHTLTIAVTPRDPVGSVEVPGASGRPTRFLLVDRTGRVLWTAAQAPTALPALVGIAAIAPPGGIVRPLSLARATGDLVPDLAGRAASVAMVDGSLVVQVAGGPQVRFGEPTDVRVKSRVAAAVLATLGGTPMGYLDVSVPSAPVSGA